MIVSLQRQIRHVGDTLSAIAATLKRPDGTAVDLTAKTVKFKMVSAETGIVKVAETATGVSVTDAAAGKCQYSPAAADVDTAGIYYGYFTVMSGSDKDTFPVRMGELEIVFSQDEEAV